MVKPTGKKKAAFHVISQFNLSERKACQLIGISRTAYRYQPVAKDEDKLRHRLKELASDYSRDGYLILYGLLKDEGLVINKKRIYRLYTEEGLQVRTKKRKKITRSRISMEVPTGINQRWSMDFVSDQLSTGRR